MGQLEDLKALREALFAALEDADVAVKAQVAGQLRAVIKDLAALGDEGGEVSKADELIARREARRAVAGDSSLPTGRNQPRRRGGRN